MEMIELVARNGKLKLFVNVTNDDTIWYSKLCLTVDGDYVLGHDAAYVLCDRLVTYLSGSSDQDYRFIERANANIIWILTLSEPHSTLYGTPPRINGQRAIYFCDVNAILLPYVLYLDKCHIDDWLLKLKKLKQSFLDRNRWLSKAIAWFRV